MKVVLIQARAGQPAGTVIDLDPVKAAEAITLGVARSEAEHTAITAREAEVAQLRKERLDSQKAVILAKVADGKKRGSIPPKDETVLAKAVERLEKGVDFQMICESIDERPAVQAARPRLTTSTGEAITVSAGEPSGNDLVKAVINACEPFQAELRNGGIMASAVRKPEQIVRAQEMAREKSRLMAVLAREMDGGFVIRAANYVDPAGGNPLGLLNTELMVLKNLGFLENQLPMLDDITMDIAGQPVAFNQQVRSRYFNVPKVQLKTASNAWTGGTGSNVDVNVLLDTHAGVPITLNNNYLASTPRNLAAEQYDPQLYALGEYITYKLVNTIINGNTRIANDGSTTSTIKFCNGGTGQPAAFSVSGSTLSTFVADLPEAMDEAKMPGGDEPPNSAQLMRFAWVHGRVYASAAADTNFLLNQSIWGARNMGSNGNIIETGRFNRIGNLKFRKSQLMTDQCSVSGSGADATTNGISVSAGTYISASTVGFAGTKSAMLFVSRVPDDYTKILPGLPQTAAVEVATSPNLGISFLIVKYLDHSYETANVRAQLMFGFGIGDERQGILLTR